MVESFTDAGWSANRQHRKSTMFTSSAIQFVNGSATFALRILKNSKRVRRITHLSANYFGPKAWFFQEKFQSVGQIPTEWNYSDIGAKPLSRSRLLVLLNQVGAVDLLKLFPKNGWQADSQTVDKSSSLNGSGLGGLGPLAQICADATKMSELQKSVCVCAWRLELQKCV
eukprot:s4292_g4.t1